MRYTYITKIINQWQGMQLEEERKSRRMAVVTQRLASLKEEVTRAKASSLNTLLSMSPN